MVGVACGGDDSGSADAATTDARGTIDATSADADTTAVQVLFTSPPEGATGVSLDTTVSVSFDEVIDPSTVSTNSFTLEDDLGAPVTGAVVSSVAGATFTPDSTLSLGTTYVARVSTAVTDIASNPLAAEFSWSFETERCLTFAGTWYTSEANFSSVVEETQLVDFETRGDGVTVPPVGTVVPRDEYLACCGIRLEYEGTDPTGELIWAGNSTSGFSVRTNCAGSQCTGGGPQLVRVIFGAASAVGGEQPATNAVGMYDSFGEITSNTGSLWLGYASTTPITYTEFGQGNGSSLKSLRYQLCQ